MARSNLTGQPYSLLRRFSLLSLLSVAVVFGVFSILLSDFLSRDLIRRDARVTMEFLQSVVDLDSEIAHRQGRRPDLGDGQFEQFFEHVSRLPDVLRANVYTPDRRVIWSSDKKVERLQLRDNHELDAALRGELRIETGLAGPTIRNPSERI
jgi:hypothetical protein